MYSKAAVELMVFTCAAESNGGTYLKQIKGPAVGIYQMEPATYNDIWARFIRKRGDIGLLLSSQFDVFKLPDETRMIYDLNFATAMARIHYARVPLSLPEAGDDEAIWEYYKKYYNTPAGKAQREECLKKYYDYIGIKKSVKKRLEAQAQPDQQESA
jgi:hypothetical protein